MRIQITRGPSRPRPAVGDRKMIGGVEHVRDWERVKSGPHKGAYVVRGSRSCFEWVPLNEAPEHLRQMAGRWIGKQRPAQPQPELAPDDLRKLQHMLGATPGHYPKTKWGFRNYYATSGGPATEAMKRMEVQGLVRLGYTSECGMAYYHATEAGCRAAGLVGKQIKRALEDD